MGLLPHLALARTMVGRGLIPLLPTAFAPAMLLLLIGNPSCSNLKEGAFFAHSVPLRLFLVGAILNFFLGPQKLTFEKLNRKLHFVSSTVTIIFFKYLKNGTS